MNKPLNITDVDRVGVKVTYNVNRFEVYHANGWMMTAAQTKTDLKSQLAQNGIKDAMFDGIAQRMYLGSH
jgi:hypothetical protein